MPLMTLIARRSLSPRPLPQFANRAEKGHEVKSGALPPSLFRSAAASKGRSSNAKEYLAARSVIASLGLIEVLRLPVRFRRNLVFLVQIVSRRFIPLPTIFFQNLRPAKPS